LFYLKTIRLDLNDKFRWLIIGKICSNASDLVRVNMKVDPKEVCIKIIIYSVFIVFYIPSSSASPSRHSKTAPENGYFFHALEQIHLNRENSVVEV